MVKLTGGRVVLSFAECGQWLANSLVIKKNVINTLVVGNNVIVPPILTIGLTSKRSLIQNSLTNQYENARSVS